MPMSQKTQTSNSMNFFVQIPTSARRNSISQLMDQQGGYGAFRDLNYTLLDQAGQAIIVDVEVSEVFSNITKSDPGIPNPTPITIQANAEEFNDRLGYLIPSCPPPFTVSFTQKFTVKIGQTTYNLNNSNSISYGRDAQGNKFVNVQ